MSRKETWKNADYPNRRPSWQKHRGYGKGTHWNTVNGLYPTKEATRGTVILLRLNGNAVKVVPFGNEFEIKYHKK